MAQLCKSCGSTKGSEAFIHPTTLKQGKTCADCIMKRSAAASSRPAAGVDATLNNHAARLDDHETRIAVVERSATVSSRADFAEWMPLKDPSEPVGPGDLVEEHDGKISRVVTGRGSCFVVSTAPFLTGNVPDAETLATGRAVVMIGQAPVKVAGAVREGQCLAASGEDDGTAVASDCPTGIKAMEAAEALESFQLVRALVNAGSHAIAAPELTKKQKRRRARKQKNRPAADFVFVAADGDSEATDETDLDSLASSHSCVRKLIEENKQLYAALRGTRVLFRDPSLLQRVGRGFVARRRAAGILRAIVKIQAASRASLKVAQRRALLRSVVSLQSRVRVRRACAVLYRARSLAASTKITASARRYLVLTTTVVGKLLSRTRLQAKGMLCMKESIELLKIASEMQARDLRHELQAAKDQLQATTKELDTAAKLIAVHDEETKNTVHALAVIEPNVAKWSELMPRFLLSVIKGKATPTAVVAERIINEKFKVEVHGRLIHWSPGALKRKMNEEWHRGTITSVLDNGEYKVQFENLTGAKTRKKTPLPFPASDLRFV
jgi:hypothetical protein